MLASVGSAVAMRSSTVIVFLFVLPFYTKRYMQLIGQKYLSISQLLRMTAVTTGTNKIVVSLIIITLVHYYSRMPYTAGTAGTAAGGAFAGGCAAFMVTQIFVFCSIRGKHFKDSKTPDEHKSEYWWR